MTADPGGSPTRWTPRARRLAAVVFLAAAIVGFGAALFGAVCNSFSVDCLRYEGRSAVRIAVIAAPFLVYGVYRFSRGARPPGDG